MKNTITIMVLAAGSFLLLSCDKENNTPADNVMIIKATGDINDDVSAFKNMLGPLNTTPGVKGGHREINWDGVPDSLLDKPLPADFFNQTAANASSASQRGLTYSPGAFTVSDNGFASINSSASSEFSTFSGDNAFANTTASKWDVKFQTAGTTESASVESFGLVFSDVDEDNSTSLEFFNDDRSLGKYFVPAHDANSSFSFFGISFKNGERITKVTVEHAGFLSEGIPDISQGGLRDLIVLDDFIYSEPVAL